MTTIILTLLGLTALLFATEILWKKKYLQAEVSRKIVHISVGTVIAFWPHFISWQAIQLLCLGMFVAIAISYKFRIFGSIHDVKRSTKGELIYPISIGLCALIEPAPWVFTAAVLHLSIADGVAAMVGTKLNGRTRYKLLGHEKSLVGTGVFFVLSLVIISSCFVVFGTEDLLGIAPVTLLLIALATTFVENISWYGLDNFSVPITVVLLLSLV